MRGKGLEKLAHERRRGITPACAGKRSPGIAFSVPLWDHPRVCGEKSLNRYTPAYRSGSPPRVRGKVLQNPISQGIVGITPARAGKRVLCLGLPVLRWDHPRVCGEKRKAQTFLSCRKGSPPRVRGKLVDYRAEYTAVGITPAYAGKSGRHQKRTAWEEDHPRVCGEKLSTTSTDIHPAGSPPPVRGKVHVCHCSLIRRRITPACAGKSSIQHLTASLGEFQVQKGHPVPHLRQRLQVWPDHARHFRHGLILHASRSAGQGRRPCRAPCPDTAGSGTPRGPSPAKRPHTSPPAATPGGCRAWQSGATAPGSR